MERRIVESKMIEIINGYKVIDLKNLNFESDLEELPEDVVYKDLSSKKNAYLKYTCESLADAAKNTKLVYYCCSCDGKKLWPSYEDLLNEKNRIIILILLKEVITFLSGFHQTILRKIAKHVSWRTKWISSTKTGSQLFDGSVSEWDMNKTMLCYWSNFYDTVHSAADPPEEYIVKDDELLDNWLESKSKNHSSNSDPDADGVRGVFKTKINPVKRK
jgi:hypothetical protein